jgi:hypothetical protein
MPTSLKTTIGFTLFFWSVFLAGVYAVNWCEVPEGASLILFAGPVALIGSVTSLVEWHVWRTDV